MTKRQQLYFSVRVDTDETPTPAEALQRVAAHVGEALGCTFAEGEYQRWYAQVANILGLRLALAGVAGAGGKPVAKLVGAVDEKGPAAQGEPDHVDISAYVADLLTIRTGLQWYQPTPEDRAAEGAAAARFDDFLGGVTDDERGR